MIRRRAKSITPAPPAPAEAPWRLALVLGGARSGKSREAEGLIARYPPPWVYIATAEAGDDEMAARIAAHRARRGAGWRTIEAPIDLTGAFAGAGTAPAVLVANEVGLGIVPENALARRFRDEAGALNARLAARADRVLFMVAGLPIEVKRR
jgi:adenosylcobinamide kinase/adenosylcobinamide-phosphate guanylyltransferase